MTPESYLKDSLNIIAHSLQLINDGCPYFYRVIALQLRLILCDTTRIHDEFLDTSLIRQVEPRVALHSIASDPNHPEQSQMLTLDDWLSEELPGCGSLPISIRKLIRHVCDTDGGAHVDQRGSQLLPPDYRQWIIRIADNILTDLKKYRD